MSEFLNQQELHQLTGYARAPSQVEWLRSNGVPHRSSGTRLIVLHSHVRAWVEGKHVATFAGPNWGAVK